jgi:hypothetical protein
MTKPVMLCVCETWAVTRQKEQSLKNMKAENNKKDLCPTKEQNGCTIQSNDEMHVVVRKLNIVTTITTRRQECLIIRP